ncbi:TPA: 2Fe-2S iron-sulfur cluster binding domain-containing protein [Candidatus Micrarchaeota archaeon]|nr:2Fe-2S iron-sulfur cluster binding domain-containing protein [Candidatus Micrarchaeota archaeon]
MGEKVKIESRLVEVGEWVRIYIMGREYRVPAGLTILKALEFVGFRLVRGVGCRAGFCGACATVYRLEGDFRLRTALACQTKVEDGMHLVQIPFTPAKRPKHPVKQLQPSSSSILSLYPELARCICCNTCTKACPQELRVMDAVQAALRGDLAKVAELTFDCVSCGICAVRCPAEITPHSIFLLARRLYGVHVLKRAKHLEERVREVAAGKFDRELGELVRRRPEELREIFASLPREGGGAED